MNTRVREKAVEVLNMFTQSFASLEQKINFVEGVFLGLFYGISGNIVVSFCLLIIESLASSKVDNMFFVNLFVTGMTATLIIAVSVKYYAKLRMLKKKQGKIRSDAIKFFVEQFGEFLELYKSPKDLGWVLEEYKRIKESEKKE